MGHTGIPLLNMGISALVKIVLSWYLTAIPWLGEVGAAWATNADIALATALNIYFAGKYAAYRPEWLYIGRVFIAAAAMAGTAVLTYYSLVTTFGNSAATLISISIAGVVYAVGLFVVRAVRLRSLRRLPVVGKYIP